MLQFWIAQLANKLPRLGLDQSSSQALGIGLVKRNPPALGRVVSVLGVVFKIGTVVAGGYFELSQKSFDIHWRLRIKTGLDQSSA